MSTGCECQFLEIERDRWYYLLEDCNAPKNSWDWREHATAYGPFSSQELAEKHLRDNHANPGGSSVTELPPGQDKVDLSSDETLRQLIETAQTSRRTSYVRPYFP